VTLNGTGDLAVVDLRVPRVVRYVPTGQRPHDLLFAPDGRLWVTDWDGPVHVFDRNGTRRGTVELGRESHHLAFTPGPTRRCADRFGSSRLHFVGTVDEVGGDAAVGEAAVVDGVEVAVGEVAFELAAEGAVAWVDVAGEGGPPALVEDGLVQGLDVAVCVRSARRSRRRVIDHSRPVHRSR